MAMPCLSEQFYKFVAVTMFSKSCMYIMNVEQNTDIPGICRTKDDINSSTPVLHKTVHIIFYFCDF